jgi:phosphomevalonate kinase
VALAGWPGAQNATLFLHSKKQKRTHNRNPTMASGTLPPGTTTVSAPGKVLILGGYAVLERPNPGLVISVDARFRVSVTSLPASPGAHGALQVQVNSPQWAGGWRGRFAYERSCLAPLEPAAHVRNKYVEDTVALCLRYIEARAGAPLDGQGGGLEVTLLAANDFYSQQAALRARGQGLSRAALAALPAHLPVQGDVAKTGLGSSAAMIAALSGALLLHCLGSREPELAHRLAQVAHAVVQGKIGSGFDVYAACFGSARYVRWVGGGCCAADARRRRGAATTPR